MARWKHALGSRHGPSNAQFSRENAGACGVPARIAAGSRVEGVNRDAGAVITALDPEPELSKYELIERIGHGGMATVYRARDRRLGREVAVKLIHAHLRDSAEVGARFASEARAVARLRHPNVVEVYDVSDPEEPERYLVVELVRGMTLRAVLNEHKFLPAELAACIGVEVAAALTHAHSHGIVHRDVKPENVLVDLRTDRSGVPDGREDSPRIKLTDFGIAKLLDAQGVTSTGQVLGSPAHMAPEQIEGGDVGPRADVFALGVMLYECMVGRLPFDGKNPAQVLRRVLEGTYPPAVQENPLVGALFGNALAGALARDPAGRYESVEEFAGVLKAELARVGIVDARREIERFLSDRAAYAASVEPEIVEALVKSAEKARESGDIPLASAQFNRALAYRPGDPELVTRVSRLVRRARLAQMLRYGLLAGATAIACIAAGALLLRGRHSGSSSPGATARVEIPAASAAGSGTPGAASGPVGQAVTEVPPGSAVRPRPLPPVLHSPPAKPKPSMRLVKVNVLGPKGGDLLIDGTRIEAQRWMSMEPLEMTVGPHRFEFVLKDPECCRVPPAITKQIDAGEGSESVVINVAFKDARLVSERAPAGVLRCPMFFPDELKVPGSRNVAMGNNAVVQGDCVLTPVGGEPITKKVTLTAGRINEISWP